MTFEDASLHRDHFKSEWHRYNLKRKVVGLKPVSNEDFMKLEQKHGQNQHQKNESPVSTKLYCKPCRKYFGNQCQWENHVKSSKHQERSRTNSTSNSTNDDPVEPIKISRPVSKEQDDDSDWESMDEDDMEGIPCTVCLFCSQSHGSLEENVKHMTLTHSFFLPDAEYISDVAALLEYLGKKLASGHICLWCQKGKSSLEAVQKHMMDTGHCKVRLEPGEDVVEYSDFYDYTTSYPGTQEDAEMEEEVEENVLEVNNDLELVLPSGATLGHRSLKVYYKQNLQEKSQVKAVSSTTRSMNGRHLVHQYQTLGNYSNSSPMIIRQKAKDMAFLHKRMLRLGVKANKLQRHFKSQIDF